MFSNKRCTVSALVLRSFNSKFPRASHILWQHIDVFKWQVNFTLKNQKYSALFNSEGKWLETITVLPPDKIPERLQLTFEEKINRDGLQQIYHVETPERSLYELNLHNGIYSLKLLYDDSGKIVGKIVS
jgi:hypothetical protein